MGQEAAADRMQGSAATVLAAAVLVEVQTVEQPAAVQIVVQPAAVRILQKTTSPESQRQYFRNWAH